MGKVREEASGLQSRIKRSRGEGDGDSSEFHSRKEMSSSI